MPHSALPNPPAGDPLAAHITSVAAADMAHDTDKGCTWLTQSLGRPRTPAALVVAASSSIGPTLNLECWAAYAVSPDRPEYLVQIGTSGLPAELAEAIHLLPLRDFADIADLPVNGDCPPTYGDFFAPVAAAHGLRAWLFASLTDPLTLTVRGALLLGSASARRLNAPEATSALSLAAAISKELATRFPIG